MFYRTKLNDHGLAHDPFKACIVPRPIGWISTIDGNGIPNLAPFSFFNAISEAPPMVMYTCNGYHLDGGEKDSVKNARETGEFVVNVVTRDLVEAMNRSSALVTRSVDEFDLAEVTKEPSVLVRPPRVKESPVHLECVVHQIIDLPCTINNWTTRMVIGNVLGIHINDNLIVNGMLRPELLRSVARMGYFDYAVADLVFQLQRPK